MINCLFNHLLLEAIQGLHFDEELCKMMKSHLQLIKILWQADVHISLKSFFQ